MCPVNPLNDEPLAMPDDAEAKSSAGAGTCRPGNYTFSPVIATDTIGAAFLGIVALTILLALLRALAHNRALELQLTKQVAHA